MLHRKFLNLDSYKKILDSRAKLPEKLRAHKKYHEDIFFPPKKFSRVDPSINEPLKQYIDLGLIRLCSRVLAATVFLDSRSTLNFVVVDFVLIIHYAKLRGGRLRFIIHYAKLV